MSTALAALDQLVEASVRVRSFGLLWAGTEDRDVKYMGRLMTLPSRDRVGDYPVLDADGTPIPGTILLQDEMADDPVSGETKIVFNAHRCITHFLGLPERIADPSTGKLVVQPKPKSFLYSSGLRLLPVRPTKAQVEAVLAEASEGWEEYLDERAKQEVESWNRHFTRAKQFGVDAMAGDLHYEQAIRRLRRRQERLSVKETVKLGLEKEAPELSEDDLEMEAWMRAHLMEKAERVVGKDSQHKGKIAEEMLTDPAVRKYLSKKYRIRKRGHAEESQEDLDAAYHAQVAARAEAELKAEEPSEA